MSGATFDYLKALVVEDNHHMRALLRSLLNALGMRNVFEATNGEDGFRLCCEKQPDLILTDLSMKPIDGIALTRQIRTSSQNHNPYVPIVMVSGHSERHRVEAARDAGVTEFLAKPITAQNLYLRIAEIVERPRAFVRADKYFGPDRRRRRIDDYGGPWRRHEDFENDVAIR